MQNTKTQITNEELVKKLEESHLEQQHKDALKLLIQKMNTEARGELLDIIKKRSPSPSP